MANDDVARVWDLMEKISFCMLATWNGSELRSRPMDARVRRKEGAIYFLTDARHLKDDEVARYPKLNLAFADTGAMKYVSLSGAASGTPGANGDGRVPQQSPRHDADPQPGRSGLAR